MTGDVKRNRLPTSRLARCERYINANTGIHIDVVPTADAETVRVRNNAPDDPVPFETLVDDVVKRFDLAVEEADQPFVVRLVA